MYYFILAYQSVNVVLILLFIRVVKWIVNTVIKINKPSEANAHNHSASIISVRRS